MLKIPVFSTETVFDRIRQKITNGSEFLTSDEREIAERLLIDSYSCDIYHKSDLGLLEEMAERGIL